MTYDPTEVADYEVIFRELHGSGNLQVDESVDIEPIVRLSDEIEALRSIVEEVSAAGSLQHSITVG